MFNIIYRLICQIVPSCFLMMFKPPGKCNANINYQAGLGPRGQRLPQQGLQIVKTAPQLVQTALQLVQTALHLV